MTQLIQPSILALGLGIVTMDDVADFSPIVFLFNTIKGFGLDTGLWVGGGFQYDFQNPGNKFVTIIGENRTITHHLMTRNKKSQ